MKHLPHHALMRVRTTQPAIFASAQAACVDTAWGKLSARPYRLEEGDYV